MNNSLKEINRFFKANSDEERSAIEKSISESIASLENFSLIQNSFRKNVTNNKSSLLFANWLVKYSNKIQLSAIEEEIVEKFYAMSLRSESAFVREQILRHLKSDREITSKFSDEISKLKTLEKNESILQLLSEF